LSSRSPRFDLSFFNQIGFISSIQNFPISIE
jgi:hypothetical protein